MENKFLRSVCANVFCIDAPVVNESRKIMAYADLLYLPAAELSEVSLESL